VPITGMDIQRNAVHGDPSGIFWHYFFAAPTEIFTNLEKAMGWARW
jgi:hypothetical protein